MKTEKIRLSSQVLLDDHTKYVSEKFDLDSCGDSHFEMPVIDIPDIFSIGLIVGSSGTGKSTLLGQFGEQANLDWKYDKAIISHFPSPEDGSKRLMAVGLNSVPTWMKPYQVLSNGEKYRAMLARTLKDNCVIDEFTSVVDRQVAKAMSCGVRNFVDKYNLKSVVVASCHHDIVEWLRPDWVYDTNTQSMTVGRYLHRPKIKIDIYEDKSKWNIFAKHHYLTSDINKSARQYVAYWEGNPVGFVSILAYPSRNATKAWRGHRLVVLPDYQGMGIGKVLSEWIAKKITQEGGRFFAKTTHPKLGEFRNKSVKWKCCSNNMTKRKLIPSDVKNEKNKSWFADYNRTTYSHEFIGDHMIKECKNDWIDDKQLKLKMQLNNCLNIDKKDLKRIARKISQGKMSLQQVIQIFNKPPSQR